MQPDRRGLPADGLCNKQAALRLFMSVPTVKWHTGYVHGTLGVSNRTGAVSRGRALGIIPVT